MLKKNKNKHLTSAQIIILGFLALILTGSLLLMLPISTNDHRGAAFTDALFTATSATCVTGLVLKDTVTYWSGFGQAIILILIQIGGMGVVTAAVAVGVISGRKIGLMQRSTLQESISAHHIGGIVRMIEFILLVMGAIELFGALLFMPAFCSEYGAAKGIWYSFFHSISAFCNAGFDLNGSKGAFSSLTPFATSPLVNITAIFLIISGGIGFFTWDDIRQHKWRFVRYRMQTKVVLVVSAILILFPAIYFFFCEFGNYPLGERIWYSIFQAVTPRTAGFNTVDLTELSEPGILLMIMLMLIGGSPSSTAGGMKITTIAVLFSTAFSVFRRKESTHFFRRRIPEEAVRTAATIFLMYIFLFAGGAMVICRLEHIPLLTALFETASAVGTVGLTLGVTPQLGLVSQFILIVLMFLGRVGGLTLIFAAMSGKGLAASEFPQEKITVG